MRIQSVSEDDNGEYACEASNSIATIRKIVKLNLSGNVKLVSSCGSESGVFQNSNLLHEMLHIPRGSSLNFCIEMLVEGVLFLCNT